MTLGITLCLVAVGLINLAPVLGILSASKMEKAYAVRIDSADLEILMRHRALLFGVLGGFILYSVFFPVYQIAAMIMAGISMIGFVVLVVVVGGYNRSIFKVLVADLVGIGLLLIAAGLNVFVTVS